MKDKDGSIVNAWGALPKEPSTPQVAAHRRQQSGSGGNKAVLTLPDGTKYEFDMLRGTNGPDCIDFRSLYQKAKLFSYDPGFTSTCSCHSSITFIDGPKGELLYRGYSIADLAQQSTFEEVSYLLLFGELPNTAQLREHAFSMQRHTMVHEKLVHFFSGFKSDAHPMSIMVGVVGALSSFYHDDLDIRDLDNRARSSYRIISKTSTIAAMAFKLSVGQPFVYPRNNLSYVENLLYMMFSLPTEPYHLNPVLVHALETWLILHMDHEQNASTSTVRIAGSSYANPYACIASGITTLWGPMHGGANEAVLGMLDEIGSADRIPQFVARAKDKEDPFRLMGFGHRVYKNYDPRAKIMQTVCHRVLEELDIQNEPLLDLALELERVALEDEYFIQRKLFPNVDFYSGIMLRAMGIPRSMFTVLFAVARTVGWISHWKEMIADPMQKIGRPRQLYVGEQGRSFVPLKSRPGPKPSPERRPRKGKMVEAVVHARQ